MLLLPAKPLLALEMWFWITALSTAFFSWHSDTDGHPAIPPPAPPASGAPLLMPLCGKPEKIMPELKKLVPAGPAACLPAAGELVGMLVVEGGSESRCGNGARKGRSDCIGAGGSQQPAMPGGGGRINRTDDALAMAGSGSPWYGLGAGGGGGGRATASSRASSPISRGETGPGWGFLGSGPLGSGSLGPLGPSGPLGRLQVFSSSRTWPPSVSERDSSRSGPRFGRSLVLSAPLDCATTISGYNLR